VACFPKAKLISPTPTAITTVAVSLINKPVAVKVQLSKQKPLIVGSYYRPPNRTDNEYVNNSINELLCSLVALFRNCVFLA
jgi:hypothetical protein